MAPELYPNLVKRYKGEPFLCTLTVRQTCEYKGAVDVFLKKAQLGSLPKEVSAAWSAWIDARPKKAHAPTVLATATFKYRRPDGIVWIPTDPPAHTDQPNVSANICSLGSHERPLRSPLCPATGSGGG